MATIAQPSPATPFEGSLITGTNLLPAYAAQLKAFPLGNSAFVKPSGLIGTMVDDLTQKATSIGDFGKAAEAVGRNYLTAYMVMSDMPNFEVSKINDPTKIAELVENYGKAARVFNIDPDKVAWIIWYMRAGSDDRRWKIMPPGNDDGIRQFIKSFSKTVSISTHYSDIDREVDAIAQLTQAQAAMTLMTRLARLPILGSSDDKGTRDWEERRNHVLTYAVLLMSLSLIAPTTKAVCASQYLRSPINAYWFKISGQETTIKTLTDLSDVLSYDVFKVEDVLQYATEGSMEHLQRTSPAFVFTEAVYTTLIQSYKASTAAYIEARDPKDADSFITPGEVVDLVANMRKNPWGMTYKIPALATTSALASPLTQNHGRFLPEVWNKSTISATADHYKGMLATARNTIQSSDIYHLATGQASVKASVSDLQSKFALRSMYVHPHTSHADKAPKVMAMASDNGSFTNIGDIFKGSVIPKSTNAFSERNIADITDIYASHLPNRMKALAKKGGDKNWEPHVNFFYTLNELTNDNLQIEHLGELPGLMPNAYRHDMDDMTMATPYSHDGLAIALRMDPPDMRAYFRSRLMLSSNPEAQPTLTHYLSAIGLLFHTKGMSTEQINSIPDGLRNPKKYAEKWKVSVYDGWLEPPNQYLFGRSIKEYLVGDDVDPGRVFTDMTPVVPLDKSDVDFEPAYCLIPYGRVPELPRIDVSTTQYATDFMSKRLPNMYVAVTPEEPKYWYKSLGFSTVDDQLAFRRLLSIGAGYNSTLGSVLVAAHHDDLITPLWLQVTDTVLTTLANVPIGMKPRTEMMPSAAVEKVEPPVGALPVGFIKTGKVWSL